MRGDFKSRLTVQALHAAYASGEATPAEIVQQILARIAARGDDGVWISRFPAEAVLAEAKRLGALLKSDPGIAARLPLFGLPFAVKDNIDVAGLPTTAACRAVQRFPAQNAVCVEKAIAAGAICLGKTNLDQFATGLVGTRSPYGVPRNPYNAEYIPGGSSSGSAVALSAGLAAFSLATDTAGSGRVPAGLNNLAGLKPTSGRVSTSGLMPACRSLDCISVLAHNVADSIRVLSVIEGYDEADIYSRPLPRLETMKPPSATRVFRLGVPEAAQLSFDADAEAAAQFDKALGRARAAGGELRQIDFSPFLEAAALLYGGPWIAERRAAFGAILEANPAARDPSVWKVLAGAPHFSAEDAFRARYRLGELVRQAARQMSGLDALIVPTLPRAPRLAEVAADPIGINAMLGTYTNAVNLLGLCALAIPNGFLSTGMPSGITLIGAAGHEAELCAIAERLPDV